MRRSGATRQAGEGATLPFIPPLAAVDEYPDLPFQPPEAAREVAVALARAFLAGENTPGAMRER
ncbi:MAG: hypothetical protein LBB55_06665, partial [Zoogloeaceae bacterium]|nr:hypothetical protein [Zoogloeaceae bacterium]